MGENDGNIVRCRLLFDDHHLLDKAQCSQGLRRCWFLLKPDITNIGDLASQIRKCFGLRHRIVLYMDDFVLPSFESTSIITDRDIIRVKRKEAKEKNICKPCDDQNVLQDSEYVMMPDMDINKNLLANGSYDKEILTSCMENSVHLDPPCEVGSTKRKGKHSKSQYDEFNHENECEPSNNSDVRKKKQASSQMVPHSSDGEEGVVASVVRSGGYVGFQPPEHGKQQADQTQKPVLVDGGSAIKEPERDKENTFSQTANNDLCLKVDGAPVSDAILPLPKSEVMSSAVDKAKHYKHSINFENLIPLRRLPLKGDILAYRYVGPSSSVYPQLSSPQVGEVSSFDCKTLQVTLRPVVDYVLLFNGNPHGAIGQPNTPRCKEDGSLEIEFLSLVDVRLVKAHDLNEDEKACEGDQAKKDNWEEASLKEKWNEPNASAAEQSNGWAQWIPNKNDTVMSRSLDQINAPFAGRGGGRGNRNPHRCMNNRIPNRGAMNWNPRRNNGAWNPNRSNNGVPAIDNTGSAPWSYRPPGLPNPWEHHQNNNFLPAGKFSGSGNL